LFYGLHCNLPSGHFKHPCAFDGPVIEAGSAVSSATAGVGHGKKSHRRIPSFLDSGFEGVAVADCPGAAGAAEDDPAARGAAVEAVDVPPRLVT
jgi:hypothetical protein